MKKEKGVILALTVTFMLVFTLFGLGAMQFAGLQGQGIVKKVAATQGFWIAEAGIEKEITHLRKGFDGLPFAPPNIPELPQGEYEVFVAKYQFSDGTFSTVRWNINSFGYIPSKALYDSGGQCVRKKIYVEYGPGIASAVNHKGGLDKGGSYTIQGGERQWDFHFEDIFNIGANEMKASAIANGTYYYDPKNNVSPITGISWVDVIQGGQLGITCDNWTGSGVLVINAEGVSNVNLHFEGGTFTGILWVIGDDVQITGNMGVSGTVFLDNGTSVSKLKGNTAIAFDKESIDSAFKDNNIEPNYNIVAWKELI